MESRADLSPTAQFNSQHVSNQSFEDLNSLDSQPSLSSNMLKQQQTTSCQAGFREFLENQVKYREAVRINDPLVCNAIHLSYRLQYLKDTAMARFIDDPTSHQITQLIATYQQ